MWALIFSIADAMAVDCPVAIVRPEDPLAVQSPISQQEGLRALPRGSLVRERPDWHCDEGVGVEVLSVVYFYQELGTEQALHRTRGCMSRADLVAPSDERYLALAPPPGWDSSGVEPGAVLGPLRDSGSCEDESLQFGHERVETTSIRWLRAISPELLCRNLELQDYWIQRYGSVLMGRIWLSDWGYLSVPMLRYRDADQIAREWEREDLRTPEQRERAVTALGPSGLWLHFLGADARFSDAWALPETVVSLVDLTESWLNFCAGMEISDRQQCTIQLGDLAWYNDRRPDPLGHKDHYSGQCVDLRLFRSDGSRYEAYWNRPDDRPGRGVGYDRVLTQAFVDFARDRAAIDVVYFNDPEVSGVETARGHDDHIHLCFAQPERGIHDRDEP